MSINGKNRHQGKPRLLYQCGIKIDKKQRKSRVQKRINERCDGDDANDGLKNDAIPLKWNDVVPLT